MMGWHLFAKIVLLIIINAFVIIGVKCMHDSLCTKCKKNVCP
jgi:hypothetical protein